MAASNSPGAAAAADPSTGTILVNLVDGSRQPIPADKEILLTIRDGFQNQRRTTVTGSPIKVAGLTVFGNQGDNYAVLASADGYHQAGFYPIRIAPHSIQTVSLMLLPKSASFNFAQARWTSLEEKRPALAAILKRSTPGDAAAFYADLMEKKGAELACLLNIATVMQQVFLPQGTPLDYIRAILTDDLRQDRFFSWVSPKLIEQVRQALQHGIFEQESSADLLLHSDPRHGQATSSFKQVQFGESNLQLTFHEHETRDINGEGCILLEADIDYYKDLGAHALLEVLPNQVSGTVSNPEVVYVLRWMAGQRAGLPEFDPLYTLA